MGSTMVDKKTVRFSASEEPKRKKGWRFRPFRRSNKESREPTESEEHSFPSDKYNKFLEAAPVDRSHATAQPRAKNKREFSKRKEVFLNNPPPASQAAFGGPPRYDWIDIETNAAIKVQAAYRRNKVMNDLERQGISTGAIRNRARRRHADASHSFLNLCGANFTFADFSSDDREAHREYQKLIYEEQKKSRFQYEEDLRHDYSKLYNLRKSKKNQLDEAFEVVS